MNAFATRAQIRDSLVLYSRFVYASKLALGVLILLVLVFAVAVPLLGTQRVGIRVAFSEVQEQEDAPPIMVNPRFRGLDEKHRPYLITARTAMQKRDDVVVLQDVTADLTTKEGTWLALIAGSGRMNLQEDTLWLQDGVQLFHDAGHDMRTQQVRVDLTKLNAFAETPVQIQGAFGHITADRFAIFDKGDRMIFTQNVQLSLLP